MKLCRYQKADGQPRVGLWSDGPDGHVRDLTGAGLSTLTEVLEAASPTERLAQLASQSLPQVPLSEVKLLPPVDRQEIWAAGVTYLRSKTARMEESDFSASAYGRIYDAERPELFFKCLPEKAVGPGEPVGIRQDARWNVPEPELTLAINSQGRIAGYTIGNDMSSRDIEGENTLYLPQAKVYHRSCSIGPFIVVGPAEEEVRGWSISLKILRDNKPVFEGETQISQMKRRFDELARFLYRSQKFPHGTLLLTGTGIVPPDTFTLEAGDRVQIRISGIGLLENDVIRV